MSADVKKPSAPDWERAQQQARYLKDRSRAVMSFNSEK